MVDTEMTTGEGGEIKISIEEMEEVDGVEGTNGSLVLGGGRIMKCLSDVTTTTVEDRR